MAEIATNPDRLAYFLAIREAIGEGHDQFVDDMYSSNDGRLLIVSRPSFADVVAISLRPARSSGASRSPATAPTTWRSRRTASGSSVSASTADVVHVLRVTDGKELGQLPVAAARRTRTSSSTAASRILHASIGMVYTPARPAGGRLDQGRAGAARSSTPRTFKVLRRYQPAQGARRARARRTSAPPYAR